MYCIAPDPESHTKVALLPNKIAPGAGVTIFAADGGMTVKNAIVVRLTEPVVAATVSGNVPNGEFEPVAIASDVVPEPDRLAGLKLATAPVGRPEMLKTTAPVVFAAVTASEYVAFPPGPVD